MQGRYMEKRRWWERKCKFICVCAIFVVPLQPQMAQIKRSFFLSHLWKNFAHNSHPFGGKLIPKRRCKSRGKYVTSESRFVTKM